MELLILLVTGQGRLVTRDEIAASLWGPDVFVDVNLGINTLIRKIRYALKDRAESPRYVETVSGKGYRFVSELVVKAPDNGLTVTGVSAATETTDDGRFAGDLDPIHDDDRTAERRLVIKPKVEHEVLEQPSSPAENRPRDNVARITRRNLLWATGAAAVAGGAAWVAQTKKRNIPERVLRLVVDLPDGSSAADPGQLLGAPAVAPDGSCLVVALGTVAGVHLFKRYLDADSFIRLDGTEGASFPFWSPDSQNVGFFSRAQLKRIPIAGGNVVSLCKAAVARGGAWGRDRQILFSASAPYSTLQEIFVVSESGGPVHRVTALDRARGENSHRYPSFLGDRNEFLYFIRSDHEDVRGVYLDSLNHQRPRSRLAVADGPFAVASDASRNLIYVISEQSGKVVAQQFDRNKDRLSAQTQILIEAGALISMSDTGILAARISRPESTRLCWRTESGEDAGRLGERGDYWSVDISPDDARIAIVKHNSLNGEFSPCVAATSRGLFEPVSKSRHVSSICWASGSSVLYYSDNRNGILYRRNIAGGGPEEEVFRGDVSAHIQDVSRGERYIVAELLTDSSIAEIGWAELKRETHAPPVWRRISAFGDWWIHPSLSPDARWLAFASRENGRSEIYISNFPSCNVRQQISTGGGNSPRWRGDGNAIFFIGLNGAMMAASCLKGDWKQSLKPKQLFSLRSPLTSAGPIYDYQMSRKRFLVIEEESGPTANRIEIVSNWHALLQQST